MFPKHSLVAYKDRPALIIENSPDLRIELEDGRTQKIRSKDISLSENFANIVLKIEQIACQRTRTWKLVILVNLKRQFIHHYREVIILVLPMRGITNRFHSLWG